MGIAETIPGVSGGTIAFITGIYERLLKSIKSFGPDALKAFRNDGMKGLWLVIDGTFLLVLLLGMLLGILGGVFGMSFLLENYPLQVWGFFFGLILASVVYIAKQVRPWGVETGVGLVIAMILAYWVTIATPAQGSESLLYVFICGAIAISALMLPGLSGSFMLLLMGMYPFILHETLKEGILENHDPSALVVMGVFVLGCLLGLLTFSRMLSWLFDHYKNVTLSILTGFMIGSLNKVWPWQKVLSTRINSKGAEQVVFSESIGPNDFQLLQENFFYGTDPQFFTVLIAMVIGFASVFFMERLGKQ